jgi:hypothetical protein
MDFTRLSQFGVAATFTPTTVSRYQTTTTVATAVLHCLW